MPMLLDTNVVSELIRRSPNPTVKAWVLERAYGNIAAVRRSAGRPVAPMDCQMAAIAACRGMAVATRNVRDFEDMGIEIVDPWAAV